MKLSERVKQNSIVEIQAGYESYRGVLAPNTLSKEELIKEIQALEADTEGYRRQSNEQCKWKEKFQDECELYKEKAARYDELIANPAYLVTPDNKMNIPGADPEAIRKHEILTLARDIYIRNAFNQSYGKLTNADWAENALDAAIAWFEAQEDYLK